MQVTHFPPNENKDFLKLFKPAEFNKALKDPGVSEIKILKLGTRTVYAGAVYEIQENGNPKRIGLSWQNTTETLEEHNTFDKEKP